MVMKEVVTNAEYVKWAEVEPGQTCRGYYLETKASKNYPDQDNHYIETKEGQLYGLNGCGGLDSQMKQVPLGCLCAITYLGMKTMEGGRFKGGNAHAFKVQYDDEDIHPRFKNGVPAQTQNQQSSQAQSAPALSPPEQQQSATGQSAQQTQTQTQQTAQTADTQTTTRRKVF